MAVDCFPLFAAGITPGRAPYRSLPGPSASQVVPRRTLPLSQLTQAEVFGVTPVLKWLQKFFSSRRKARESRLIGQLEESRGNLPPLLPGSDRRLLNFSLDKSPGRDHVPAREDMIGAVAGNRRRLNSLTMRSIDLQQKTLATDWVHLRNRGLPEWITESDLANALGIELGELRWFASHRIRDRVNHYVPFTIPKRNGTRRLILSPKPRLKIIQRKLLRQLVDRLPVHEASHGFRQGRSIATSAVLHVGRNIVVSMDLKDFFASVTFFRIRGLLLVSGYGFPVATTLAVLMTEAERRTIPIGENRFVHEAVSERYCVPGAPTSPGLCNTICCRMDRRLHGLASSLGWTYTRYADDMTFSGQDESGCRILLRAVSQICEEEGFRIHPDKTRVSRRNQCQKVTGVVVNDVAGLSRQKRRRLRAMAHRLKCESLQSPRPDDFQERVARLRGYVAYLAMLNPDQARQLQRCWRGML